MSPVQEMRRWQVVTEGEVAINVELWVDLTTHFDRYFGRIVGPAAEVAARASRAGRRFYHGQATCAAAFG